MPITSIDSSLEPRVIPGSTYRLQFHAGFRFTDATALVAYLHSLGVSHLYASSYLKARTGSQHGYDIVDHNALNPEIGVEADHAALCAALAANGMSQILDIVPNHMGVLHNDNPWWVDVVENGLASPWSDAFDIDWAPSGPRLDGQVLLAILGGQYGEVLERGELQLAYDDEGGRLVIRYFDHTVPVRPQELSALLDLATLPPGCTAEARDALAGLLSRLGRIHPAGRSRGERRALRTERIATQAALRQFIAAHDWAPAWIDERVALLNGRAGEAASFDALHALIERQPWRLAYWRVGADEVNYRRFFEVSTLAAIRMEDPDIFAESHATILRWVGEGKITGLRVDHPDGLAEPRQYFERLQQACASAAGVDGPTAPLYLAIEKILAQHEHWPADWPVHGDTGYRFSNLVNGLFVHRGNESAFDRLYAEFVGRAHDYAAELLDAKRYVIFHLLASDLHALSDVAFRIAQRSRRSRDFTYNGIRSAIVELAAGMPVYRTYVGEDGVHEMDREHLAWAMSTACERGALIETETIRYLVELMTDAARLDERRLRFVRRFQQFTSPVMAKAMEDTAFYRFHRLVSLNDVGGEPMEFGLSVDAFHAANRARARHLPHCMLGSSTHDSKRSEDLRARLDVLSEIPQEWAAAIARWRQLRLRQVPAIDGAPALDPNDEMLLYQTLVGAWPLRQMDDTGLATLRERIQAYMQKALREAKVTTSWLGPNEAYEAEVTRSIELLLGRLEPNPFLTDLRLFVETIAEYGCANGLSLVALKLTAPGVPDIYQGCETWNLSLVDPDNRRPVDFDTLASQLRRLAGVWAEHGAIPDAMLAGMRSDWRDGRLKLLLTWRLLQLRSREPALMAGGSYEPLRATGPAAPHVVAFARADANPAGPKTVTVATRLLRTVRASDAPGAMTPECAHWEGTTLPSPTQDAEPWEDVVSGRRVWPSFADGCWSLPLDRVLQALPVAVLRRPGAS